MTVTPSAAVKNRVPLSDKKIKEMFHLEMSELISCVEIHTCMHAFICLILCVARSSVVSLQVINMWTYIQSKFVLAPLIQGTQIGFYAWTLVLCTDLMASSPCCEWKPINDNTQQPKQHHRNTWWRTRAKYDRSSTYHWILFLLRSNLVFIDIAHVYKNVDCLPFYLPTVLSKDITLRYTNLECNGHVLMVRV